MIATMEGSVEGTKRKVIIMMLVKGVYLISTNSSRNGKCKLKLKSKTFGC